MKHKHMQPSHECDNQMCIVMLVATVGFVFLMLISEWHYWGKKFEAIQMPLPIDASTFYDEVERERLKNCQDEWRAQIKQIKQLRQANLELRTDQSNCTPTWK
jgi:hypothetical protein